MQRLDGKVAIITGGARGMGAAEGRLFAAEGATVYLTDVLAEEGRLTARDADATFIEHDVTQPEQWRAVVDQVLAERGRIDVLVNNAGIFRWADVIETTLETWNQVLAVNQTGVFLGMQSVAPAMIDQGGGSIINISSVGGLSGSGPCFAYGATKWAVRGMTKGAAQTLGKHGIRVNSIHPGWIETPMTEGFPDLSGSIPLGRSAGPDEVALQALWLASDESRYSSGAEFIIDGGMTA